MDKRPQNELDIDEIASFCKKKGFVFPSSEIYGGISGFFDFGPYGVELFNNIKQHWWKHFVHDKENMVGMDASIISNPRVWKASGHLDSFGDMVLSCSKCNNKLRADHFIGDATGRNVEGVKASDINMIIQDNGLVCPKCRGAFKEVRDFNLLFRTFVGAEEGSASEVYLRGETAQGMFTDFRLIAETTRQKLPFGIAQVGKCFRNEISPRDFMFRSREFTIAEFEFFIHPDDKKCDLLTKAHLDLKVMLLDKESQDEDDAKLKETTIGKMVEDKRLDGWHAYWLAEQMMWFYDIGLKKEDLKIREHTKKELSHYSSATFDIDYNYPFSSKEIAGNANRGQYDLNQHIKESKEKLAVFDEDKKEHIIPRVIEPTFGMERVFLAVLVDAYDDDKERGNIVLRLDPRIAPTKVAVFPLVNKVNDKAREVFESLRKDFTCFYDRSGSIGRRYARADELGIPFCVTIDFDTLQDSTVTVRDRDSTRQLRMRIDDLKGRISCFLAGEKFE
ncbi:glycine--tRNA ligase [Candidatus Woesearchaeota archaeon]|nr:glycine--tRNA ligase [Candidatus Woesearchaeota archaeon]